MRISDWSSDVCSSDLAVGAHQVEPCGIGVAPVDDDLVGVGAAAYRVGNVLIIDAEKALHQRFNCHGLAAGNGWHRAHQGGDTAADEELHAGPYEDAVFGEPPDLFTEGLGRKRR